MIQYFNLSFTRIAEFCTDKTWQLLIVILIIKLFDLVCFNTRSKKLENIILLIPLLGFCITLKTYFLPYFLLATTILMLNNKFVRNFKYIIYSKAFLGPKDEAISCRNPRMSKQIITIYIY